MNRSKLAGPYRNRLLSLLSAEDLALLQPHLKPVSFDRRTLIETPHRHIEHVYFIEHGIASVVAVNGTTTHIEVGIIGCEGLAGLSAVLGKGASPHSTYIQIPGSGQRIATAAFLDAVDRSRALLKTVLNFTQSFMTQVAQTAVANARATLEQRLARWILMAHDRVDGDDIPLTHELLALMMGARRPGITEAMHTLSDLGLVRARRALITVTDRPRLETLVGRYYGVPETEYDRLLG